MLSRFSVACLWDGLCVLYPLHTLGEVYHHIGHGKHTHNFGAVSVNKMDTRRHVIWLSLPSFLMASLSRVLTGW